MLSAAVLALWGALDTGPASQIGGLLAWVVPGLWVVPTVDRADWSWSGRQGLRLVLTLAGAWLAVVLGTGLASILGLCEWGPGGAGLVEVWSSNDAGAVALAVSAPVTLGLLHVALVVGAPLYALPMGLGLAVWSRALPSAWRWAGVTALVAGLVAAERGALSMLLPAVSFGLWAVVGSGRSMWGLALALAMLFGLDALGPLLASGPALWVGWTSPLVYAAPFCGAVGMVLWRAWPSG